MLVDTNSIMIDPNNIKQITDAIQKLRDNRFLRDELSKGALKMAAGLTIDNRAGSILSFVKSNI